MCAILGGHSYFAAQLASLADPDATEAERAARLDVNAVSGFKV